MPETLEDDSAEAAEDEPVPEAGALGSTNSEPGMPRNGRSAVRAGIHISDPYNVNLPLHITSILNVPPNIISNVSLARLTRGLECPALQPRPSPASGSCLGLGPPGEDPGQRVGLDPVAESLMLGVGQQRPHRPWAVGHLHLPSVQGEGNPVIHMKSMVRVSLPPEGGTVVGYRQGY